MKMLPWLFKLLGWSKLSIMFYVKEDVHMGIQVLGEMQQRPELEAISWTWGWG